MQQIRAPKIILASTSIYRKQLLDKLNIPFEQLDPEYEESDQPGESPHDKATRHALGKALNASARGGSYDKSARGGSSEKAAHGSSKNTSTFIIIGSDQVAHVMDHCFGKPGTHAVAASQLATCSGKWVSFTSAICLIDDAGRRQQAIESYKVKFRALKSQEIDDYLEIDRPFDCAGSIRAESAGISLLEDTKGRDINTLYGLPLMLLQETLMQLGWSLTTLRTGAD